MKQNTSQTDFKWVSQQLCELYDNVRSNKFSICFEAGCSQDLNTGIVSYLQSRLSFKIKNANISNTKIEIDFTYYDIYEFLASIQKLSEGKIQNFEQNSYNKNKHRKIIINENQANTYVILIKDNQSTQQQLSVQLNRRELNAIKTLIFNSINNWVSHSQNIQLLLSNQYISSKLENLNFNSGLASVTKSVILNPFSNPVENSTPDEQPSYEEPYEECKDEVAEPEQETSEVKDETEEENIYFDVDFKVPASAPTIDTTVSNQLSSLLSDDSLSQIELDGKKFDYTTRVVNKVVNTTPRPFLNNFLNWNVDVLFDWVNGLILCDSNTNDNTLKSIEMFLLKSIGRENSECILNSKYINQLQFDVISNIKDTAKRYISNDISVVKSKSLLYKLDDVQSITRDSNRPLWDFIVDSLALFCMFRYFVHSLDLFKQVNKNNQTDCSTDIRFACDFLYSYVITMYQSLDKNDTKQFFKEDVSNVLIALIEHDVQENLNNCFSEISMGGKLDINLNKINDFADKYIDMIDTAVKYVDFSEKYDSKFNDSNSIRTELGLLINPIVKKDLKKDVFVKYIESLEIPFDLSILDSYPTFDDIDTNVLRNETVQQAYTCLLLNPSIKNVKDLKLKVNQVKREKEIEDEARNKMIQEHSDVKKEMWDIEDSDDDLENIFS